MIQQLTVPAQLNFATLPAQESPFRLLAVTSRLNAGAVVQVRAAKLEIVFGNVVEVVQLYSQTFSAGKILTQTWAVGCPFYSVALGGAGTDVRSVSPLPEPLILDSRFSVTVRFIGWQALGDSMPPVSFLIDGLHAES